MRGPSPDDLLLFDGFRFDRQAGGLFRVDESGSTSMVPLGSRALDLLALLARRSGDTVTKEEIMTAVWPGRAVEEANLNVQVSKLRHVLDQDRPYGSCIQTVTGYGYRFMADVTPISRATPPSAATPSAVTHDDATASNRVRVASPNEKSLDGAVTTQFAQPGNLEINADTSHRATSIYIDSFLLSKLGAAGKIDEDMAAILLDLRSRLIDEYTDGTAPMLLIEQVVAAYQAFVRVAGWVAGLSATVERELFDVDQSHPHSTDRSDSFDPSNAAISQHLAQLHEHLVPLTEQCAGVMRNALAALEMFRVNL
jgi:DNA-binding winged helix-turn-helix (wHTH) protein